MRILLPITLDRWRHSIATAQRETSIRIRDFAFYSFSNPATEEDRILGESIWTHSHLHRVSLLTAFKGSYDIVHHSSSTNRNLTASFLARLRSLGKCGHLFSAQVEPFPQDPWYRHFHFSVRAAHKITAVSKVVADGVMRHFGRAVDAVIPNGVDLSFFSREAARPLDFESLGFKPPFVVFSAHLEARKRPDVFIELSKLLPDLHFVMLGSYSQVRERDSYLRLIRELPNVRYLGLQPRSLLRDLYAQATALVFPSEIEGLALSVVEAQAMGLPVLAQPRTCMPELIAEGITGWLLPVEHLDVWAKRLKEVLAWSDSERKSYAAKSRQLTAERYSWDVIAPQYREMYLATQKR